MVRRDPETGQFVSGDDQTWNDMKRMVGVLHAEVPAADLGGGAFNTDVDGSDAEILDFGEALENDEVFITRAIHVVASASSPTTATAEGSMEFGFALNKTGEIGDSRIWKSPAHYTSSIDRESGVVDIAQQGGEAGSAMYAARLHAENSIGDSTNGLGGGADTGRLNDWVSFHDGLSAGPMFDRDDALYCPVDLNAKNISDHAILGSVVVTVHGTVEKLD